MKGILFILAFCNISSLYAQPTPPPGHEKIAAKQSSMIHTDTKSDKAILSELNAQFIKNFITQDTASHNKIIYKDFICIEGSGAIVNREDYIKGWAHAYEESGYTSFSHTEEYIRIFGNMALVRSKTPYTKKVNGKEVKGCSVYTDTYIKENGRWWCVQAHITRIADYR